jgi:hypothetical protein
MHQEENSHCNFGALCLYIGGCRANLGPSPGQMSTAVVGNDHVVIAVIINAMRQGFIVIEEAFQLLYLFFLLLGTLTRTSAAREEIETLTFGYFVNYRKRTFLPSSLWLQVGK